MNGHGQFIPNKNLLSAFALSAVVAISLAPASWAGFFGDHPSYLHAIKDLKTARNLLQRPEEPNVTADEQTAIVEIDKALGEIKQAARDDWKEDFIPSSIDTSWHHHERLREAAKLIHKAHDDISKEEDDRYARGLRDRARRHLDVAISAVDNAMADKSFDKHHGL